MSITMPRHKTGHYNYNSKFESHRVVFFEALIDLTEFTSIGECKAFFEMTKAFVNSDVYTWIEENQIKLTEYSFDDFPSWHKTLKIVGILNKAQMVDYILRFK